MLDLNSPESAVPERRAPQTAEHDLAGASFSVSQHELRSTAEPAAVHEPARREPPIPAVVEPSSAEQPLIKEEGLHDPCISERRKKCCGLSRNHFVEEAKPFVIEGRDDRPTLLFYGGLAGTGWPWKEFAAGLNRDCGNRVEVYSLTGHDGCWDSLVKKTQSDWVSDIIARAEASKEKGFKPVFFGYSTSAVAAIEAAAMKPDLFGALVLIGAPIQLKDWKFRVSLNIVEAIDRWVPFAKKLFEKIPISLPPDPPGTDPENILSKQPSLESIPLSTLISLIRLQRDAKAALSEVRCPVLVIQGTQDKYVDMRVARAMYKMLASEQKEFVAVDESPHAVMLSRSRESIKTRIKEWYERLRGKSERSEPHAEAEPG